MSSAYVIRRNKKTDDVELWNAQTG